MNGVDPIGIVHLVTNARKVLLQLRFCVQFRARSNTNVTGTELFTTVIPEDFTDPVDFPFVNVDVGIGRSCKGH